MCTSSLPWVQLDLEALHDEQEESRNNSSLILPSLFAYRVHISPHVILSGNSAPRLILEKTQRFQTNFLLLWILKKLTVRASLRTFSPKIAFIRFRGKSSYSGQNEHIIWRDKYCLPLKVFFIEGRIKLSLSINLGRFLRLWDFEA